MTHQNSVTNGASLEDCHTNFFALADLCGIKWRRLCADSVLCVDPLDDPVLSSFSKCLAADILCVWRRVARSGDHHHHHHRAPDSHHLNFNKELWIFWYREEPDLSGLICPELTDVEHGSWESGLSYECRTLLFKALHNLIERCILARGYTRLGKWFVEPQEEVEKAGKSMQLTFSFKFFVHGDSTVCASVDVRQRPAVYKLSRQNLLAAQVSNAGVKVVLSPYGLSGTLTGQSYKETDQVTQRLLSEWRQFYPLADQRSNLGSDEQLPTVLEVVVAGIRMRYPCSYVFVIETDEQPVQCANSNDGGTRTAPKSIGITPLLTPPTSPPHPCDNYAHDTYTHIKNNVGQDSTVRFPPGPGPDVCADEAIGHWDFYDPNNRASCNCSRCQDKGKTATSKGSQSTNGSAPTNLTVPNAANSGNTTTNKKGEKQQRSREIAPFHRRSPISECDTVPTTPTQVPESAPSGAFGNISFQYKGMLPSLRASTPCSLPQLQQTSFNPPSSVDSHPATPLLVDSSSQPAADPAMPTLSPHPPGLPEEETSKVESQDGASEQSPPIQEPTSVKAKTPTDQILSPYHTPVNVKAENSPAFWQSCNQTEESVSETAAPFSAATTPAPLSVTASSNSLPVQGLKRPVLPLSGHEDVEEEDLRNGLLYDYSALACTVWDGNAPNKRRRMNPDARRGSDPFSPNFASRRDSVKQCEEFESLPTKPKDPYEFNDENDEEGPASASSFRNSVFPKDEEKGLQPGIPLTPDPSTPAPPTGKEGEGGQPASPPTPRNQGSSFTREEDLQVTDRDLEQIFDTSSDESSDDMFQPPSTPSSTKLTSDEPMTGKSNKNSCTTGILGAAELTRMFPTPPSMEHNTAASPSCPLGGPDITVLDGVDGSSIREKMDAYASYGSPGTESDWTYVYKLPAQQKFVSSPRFAALPNLPSAPVSMPAECAYKPSWQQFTTATSAPSVPSVVGPVHMIMDRQMSNSGGHPSVGIVPDPERLSNAPPYPMEVLDQRGCFPLSYELQSPASNASSCLNKHLNSVDNSLSTMPEAHSLLVNLVLSESLLNLFKDHNFDGCTVCVCNMNIKGADTGVYLPDFLVPTHSDEPQYKCTCGFSAVVNRHHSHRAGLFYEDELEITGVHYDASTTVDRIYRNPKDVPHAVMDLIRTQCSTLYSACSVFHKALGLYGRVLMQPHALEFSDGCEVCFLALDMGRLVLDGIGKPDDVLKFSCLHKWPYLLANLPASNHETVQLLRSLQPLLQEAVQKKRTQGLWEVTYTVSGPLTWRQFHRLAGRGTEDQCEPQPIPSLLVGYDKDWMALSPFALKFWENLLLEPCGLTRDVAYVVVGPDNDFILGKVRTFFRELSSVYEVCGLGRHCPITKVLRDGIMRVGKTAAKKLADQPLDEWFNNLGDGPVASKLKLYAQVCRHHLAPHLATQTLDRSILEQSPAAPSKAPDAKPLSSSSPPATPESQDKEQVATPKSQDSDGSHDPTPAAPGAPYPAPGTSSSSEEQEEDQQVPSLVIYIVEPFSYNNVDAEVYRLSTIGLLRCYTQMLRFLPDHIQNNIHIQIVTLDAVLSLSEDALRNQLKEMAFSVFSQCRRLLIHQSTVKSLTGFGPAASQDHFLKGKDARNSGIFRMYSPPFLLAPLKDKQTELGEMFGDRREKSNVFFCSYCLTDDQRYLLASCTNDKGEILETCCINVEIPNRTRRKKATARKIGLYRLLDFILGVLAMSVQPWRLVVGRLGRLGHGELREWATLLSRKSLLRYSRTLRELCGQCSVLGPNDTPCVLSACLVSLESDTALRIMADQYTPDDRFTSSCHSCDLSTPQDATCTHILVFPTSATTQSTQVTFQQEHIDPLSTTLGDDDIFQALNDDDITVGQDINDIFRWTESPTQSPGNSPRRDCISQPGSPVGRQSPFQHGGPNRGSGCMAGDTQEEPLQLLQQPLALGYYVSTAKTGPLPKWFWARCPQVENACPVFLKSALLIHSPSVQQNSDELLHANPHLRNYHPLDSNLTTDVLRYVLEGFNSLSWLALDPATHDRRSCLPVHIQVLMQLYHAIEALA